MRTLFTAAFFLFLGYMIYTDAPSRLMFSATTIFVGVYFIICFIEDWLIEFRKELADRKNNE